MTKEEELKRKTGRTKKNREYRPREYTEGNTHRTQQGNRDTKEENQDDRENEKEGKDARTEIKQRNTERKTRGAKHKRTKMRRKNGREWHPRVFPEFQRRAQESLRPATLVDQVSFLFPPLPFIHRHYAA
jgi:hypothetical protein